MNQEINKDYIGVVKEMTEFTRMNGLTSKIGRTSE